MAQIIKEIRVDVSQPNVFQAIVAKQNDCNSRFLKVTLTDCGVKINIESTAKVTINANRPDGESQSFVGQANDDGTVTVPLAQWMLLVVGLLKCDVSVIDTTDGERLTTTTFYVDVQEAANSNTDYSENPEGEFRVITPVTVVDENSTDDKYPSAKAVYSYGQDILADTKVTSSASGSAITIESANAPLQALKLYGKTTQDGTPTPTEPKELKSVGDSGSFNTTIDNKNLLDISHLATQIKNGVTITNNGDGSITLNGTATENFSVSLRAFHNVLDGNYIVSGCVGGSTSSYALYVCYYDKNYVYKNENWCINGDAYILNKKYDIVVIAIYVRGGTVLNNVKLYPMVRHKSYDNTFEKGKKQTLTMPYTLRSVGEVKDEIDFARGVKIQRFAEVDLGTLTWYKGKNDDLLYANLERMKIYGLGLCEKYSVLNRVATSNDNKVLYRTYTYYPWAVNIKDSSYTDAETLKADLSGTMLVYELETPIETPLSETELNAYRQLMTNSGNTTILSEADMQVDYYVNKPNAQAIGNIHSQINKDYFKLTQAIISTGGK